MCHDYIVFCPPGPERKSGLSRFGWNTWSQRREGEVKHPWCCCFMVWHHMYKNRMIFSPTIFLFTLPLQGDPGVGVQGPPGLPGPPGPPRSRSVPVSGTVFVSKKHVANEDEVKDNVGSIPYMSVDVCVHVHFSMEKTPWDLGLKTWKMMLNLPG